MEQFMDSIVSTMFISNFAIVVALSSYFEFVDKTKVFGVIFSRNLQGIRGATFATWMMLGGIIVIIAYGSENQKLEGIFAGVAALFLGLGLLLIVDICRRALLAIEKTNAARKLHTTSSFQGDNATGMFENAEAAKIIRDIAARFTDFEVSDITISGDCTRMFLYFKDEASMEKCAKEIATALREKRLTFVMIPAIPKNDSIFRKALKTHPFGFYIIC